MYSVFVHSLQLFTELSYPTHLIIVFTWIIWWYFMLVIVNQYYQYIED